MYLDCEKYSISSSMLTKIKCGESKICKDKVNIFHYYSSMKRMDSNLVLFCVVRVPPSLFKPSLPSPHRLQCTLVSTSQIVQWAIEKAKGESRKLLNNSSNRKCMLYMMGTLSLINHQMDLDVISFFYIYIFCSQKLKFHHKYYNKGGLVAKRIA